jgi:hypothetical protein
MPEAQVNTTELPAQAGQTEPEILSLVKGKLRREKGRAILTLDVSKLHSYLDFLGVQRDTASKRFAACPQSRSDIVDTGNHAIVPKALCSFEYKKDANGNEQAGVLEIDLLRHYQTPPTEPTLRQLAESVKDAATAVVTHYQPVEIAINIVGKKPR